MSSGSPSPSGKPKHIGQLVQRLREAAGLTRRELATQAKLPCTTIRNIESGRRISSTETIYALLLHPAMATLPERAKAAGLSLGVGDNGAGAK